MTEQSPGVEALATLPYTNDWRWNTQTSVPPISGQVRTNVGTWTGATHVYLSNTTDSGQDVTSMLVQIAAASTLDLSHRADLSRTVRYTVSSAPIVQATYVDVPVTFVQAAGVLPTSNTVVSVAMTLPSINGTSCAWRIYPARDPNRFWIECTCQHGRVAELIATNLGSPAPSAVVETTSLNLRRRLGCSCASVEPVL